MNNCKLQDLMIKIVAKSDASINLNNPVIYLGYEEMLIIKMYAPEKEASSNFYYKSFDDCKIIGCPIIEVKRLSYVSIGEGNEVM